VNPAQQADRWGNRWRNVGLAFGMAGLAAVAFEHLGLSLIAFVTASLCLQESSACYGWRTGYTTAQIHAVQDHLCPACRGPNQRRYGPPGPGKSGS
jgi:hypothetical protein